MFAVEYVEQFPLQIKINKISVIQQKMMHTESEGQQKSRKTASAFSARTSRTIQAPDINS